jgi:hypothetical protein
MRAMTLVSNVWVGRWLLTRGKNRGSIGLNFLLRADLQLLWVLLNRFYARVVMGLVRRRRKNE